MNCNFLGLLAMALLTAPMMANAQFTTLDCQGYAMWRSDFKGQAPAKSGPSITAGPLGRTGI
jgi:hypothetical protein